ncbi:MAG TPA: hypothetical protein VLT36_16910 [Candidatus Dormibacteraeota bacterium]|nr:hypothetical protein [Candidatus Dormibacteraeota bacterium]
MGQPIEAASDLSSTVSVLVDDAAGLSIDFTLDGIQFTAADQKSGANLKSVSQAVDGKLIHVFVWKSPSVKIARYDNGPNQFVVPRSLQTGGDLLKFVDLMVHEAVHAAFDLQKQHVLKVLDESFAYVTQFLYRRLKSGKGNPPPNDKVLMAADKVADYIIGQSQGSGTVVVPDTILNPLKEAIKKDGMYKDWATEITYDGAEAKPPAGEVGHPKRKPDSKALKHGPVSGSHASRFRTPGTYGIG